MTWRSGTNETSDKVLGGLPYLLPLFDAVVVGGALFKLIANFPALAPVGEVLLLLISPVMFVYQLVPFGLGSLAVFFALFLLVVRNENISHFIRFNTLQAILIGFIISIGSLLLSLLTLPGLELITDTLYNVLLFGGIAAVGYSIVQCLMGRYPEIPTISEAVHMQIR
ncbi:Tic20 family protein [Leptothoe sp. PORK10 BA2]|uniref:Tic20 family protein n=1 Tax=Leptothoe sp. PORK10 BA2 TaxID=3110254 RepID=UPI002B2200A7|nr:Tic20 family protein [Leptothoe sp. PORK10 BA2]MEA5465102.1 Tic20 family protein [Leptothoe sp. PORK10 BA2]